MLVLSLKRGESVTIYHGGERARLAEAKTLPDGRIKLFFDAKSQWEFVRSGAKHKQIPGPNRPPAA